MYTSNCSNLYWSPKSGAALYQIRMDELTDDATPEIRTVWQSSSLSDGNWTVVGIALNYSISTGSSDYLYWAVTDEQ